MRELPSAAELSSVVQNALRKLGGKAHYRDIESQVIQDLQISSELANLTRSGNRTELAYRLSWARTACKNKGIIRNLGNGIWEIV